MTDPQPPVPRPAGPGAAAPPAPARRSASPPVPPALPPWQPTSRTLRGLIVVLALGTALVIGWHMLQPKLKVMAARAARGEPPVPIGLPTEAHRAANPGGAGSAPGPVGAGEPPRCADRPVAGCVGGRMEVLVLPPAASR
jgi:hypothetical protein